MGHPLTTLEKTFSPLSPCLMLMGAPKTVQGEPEEQTLKGGGGMGPWSRGPNEIWPGLSEICQRELKKLKTKIITIGKNNNNNI